MFVELSHHSENANTIAFVQIQKSWEVDGLVSVSLWFWRNVKRSFHFIVDTQLEMVGSIIPGTHFGMTVEIELVYAGCFDGENTGFNIEITVLRFGVEFETVELVFGVVSFGVSDGENWDDICCFSRCQCPNLVL